ncbi:MAG: hypothetical protein JW702_09435 [Clostridiales bacterium]|nr:hypothetical protein [Clostridiales bacterium]
MKKQQALFMVLFAYIIWGIQPLYWQLFGDMPVDFIMAHRIIWSMVFVMPILFISGRKDDLIKHVKHPASMAISLAAAILIGLNWGLNV